MIAVPFVYFSILLFYQLHKNKWHIDIACFILIIYAVSAFFSILVDIFDLRLMDSRSYKISPLASFTYCGLLTMCIWPFMVFSNLNIKKIIPIQKSRVLKFLAWLFFVYFIINFLLSFNNIINVLTSDNMGQIRSSYILGEETETWLSKLPFVARLPFIPLNLLSGCPWIFIYLGFFCLAVQKMPIRYTLFFIIASLNGLIESVIGGGRSAVAYWIVGAVACYLFFLPFWEDYHKKIIKRSAIFLFVLFIIYLALMSISRFGETNYGTEGGLIFYFGQSYIDFCYFFDKYTCPIPSLQLIAPLTYKLILGDACMSVVELQDTLTFLTGNEIGVFYTFLGHIAVTSHNIVAIIYAFLLSIASFSVARKSLGKDSKPSTCYFYLLFSSVLFLGFFTHNYASFNKTFSAAIWGIFLMNQKLSSLRVKKE